MDKDELKALFVQAKEGDRAAREELVKKNLGLVGSIVKRYENRGHDKEELFQIGTIGLLNAIDKFSFGFCTAFSTYAVPLIRGEIQRFLRDDGMIHVSRSLKENGYKLQKATEAFRQEQGREPTIQELSARSGLNPEEIIMANAANTKVQSIYQSVFEADGSEVFLIDRVAADRRGGQAVALDGGEGLMASKDSEKEQLINRMAVKQMLESLPENEQELMNLRYFEELTQVQTAAKLGMTQVQVSRSEKKILQKLRKLL